jgi:hypothetical protein
MRDDRWPRHRPRVRTHDSSDLQSSFLPLDHDNRLCVIKEKIIILNKVCRDIECGFSSAHSFKMCEEMYIQD